MITCKCGNPVALEYVDCCHVCVSHRKEYYKRENESLDHDKPVRNSPAYIQQFSDFMGMLGGYSFEETIEKALELTDRKFGIGKNAVCRMMIHYKGWDEV